MTVATLETKIEYTGDASTLTFALDFPFVDASCLKAYRINSAGILTPIVIVDTTGGSQRTGWGVTLAQPVGIGYTLKIARETPIFQPKRYGENDPFPARSHEIGLDRLTMIIQELRNSIASGEFSSNPAQFKEGLELNLNSDLLPGEIGFATDSKTLIVKLLDGTIERIPTTSGTDAQLIGTAGGDLSGDYPNPSVVKLRGKGIPALSQGVLSYNGSELEWVDTDPRPVTEIESFHHSKRIWFSDPDAQIFRNDGCFCWIYPAANVDRIKFFKTQAAANAGIRLGRFSIWGGNIGDLVDGVKLLDGGIPDSQTGPNVYAMDIDVSGYKWIGVACDPAVMDNGVPVAQTGIMLPPDLGPLGARFTGYVGQHSHNTEFDSFPTIYALEAKYLMTRWMALGVVYA